MSQAAKDDTEKVVPLHRPIPMTEAERSRNYRARVRLKKLARPKRDAAKTVTKRVTAPVTPTVTKVASHDAIDLAVLRRQIQDWTKLHSEVDRLRTGREPYNPRMWFLVTAVAFFAFVAYSAAVPA